MSELKKLSAINENSSNKQIEDTNYRWYVLSVVSGQEPLVVKNLWETVKKNNLSKQVEEIFFPEIQSVSLSKKWEKKITSKKLHPWYVYVKSMMNDKIWYVLRNTPWVRLIIGSDIYPTPVSDEEMNKIIQQVKDSQERMELDIPYKVGDIVKLKSDELGWIEWEVIAVDEKDGKIQVKASLMWRETIVNVGFDKIQKIVS